MIDPAKESYDVQIDEQGEERLILQPSLSQDKLDNDMIPETQNNDSKKARTPFVLFISENKDLVKNFGKNFLKEMSQLWANLDPETKKVYVNKARIEKELYGKSAKKSLPESVVRRSNSASSNLISTRVIKTIVNLDPETANKIRPEAYPYLANALDIFLESVIEETELMARKSGKTKLTDQHLYNLASKDMKYSFLQDLKLNSGVGKLPKTKGLDEVAPSQSKERQDQMIIEEMPKESKSLAKEQTHTKANSLLNYFKK